MPGDIQTALEIIYDLTIEERGVQPDEQAEHQAIMRMIHIASGHVGKSGGSSRELLGMFSDMCEQDFKDLRIYPELRKLLSKYEAQLAG